MQIQAGAPIITSPPANDSKTAQSRPRRLLYLALVTVAVPVYVADQLTKAWAAANLVPGQPRDLIGSVLQLNLTRNSGAAFSIGTQATWVLTVIACSVVLFVVFVARRLGSRGWALALGLLLGGSLGNLTDRMFRAPGPGRGHVVDFLQLPHYPIFNIADSAIVSAAVLIAVLAFRGISIDGTRVPSKKPEHETPGTDDHETPGTDNREAPGSDDHEMHDTDDHEHQTDDPDGHRPAQPQPPKHPAGTDHDV